MEKLFTPVTIEANINASTEKVWEIYNSPEHIVKWNTAHPDWHTPKAENDLREGGNFSYRMEAKDGSFGFDFAGVYDKVKKPEFFSYTMGDGRKVETKFTAAGNTTTITVKFDAENENPIDMQRDGWQAILNSFKNYVETL